MGSLCGDSGLSSGAELLIRFCLQRTSCIRETFMASICKSAYSLLGAQAEEATTRASKPASHIPSGGCVPPPWRRGQLQRCVGPTAPWQPVYIPVKVNMLAS
eukprot:scaffold682042_cov50-Prasinocladus_malaysianus.AAC.1